MSESVNEEIKENVKKALAGMTFSEKCKYLYGYYKIPALVTIVIVAAIVVTIYAIATKKDTVFQLAVVNSSSDYDYASFIEEFGNTIEYDHEKEEVLVDSSYALNVGASANGFDSQAFQKLFAATATGQLDIIIADEETFKWIAKMGYFRNLENVMSEDDLTEYGDRLLTVAVETEDGVFDELSGIEITDSPAVTEGNWYDSDKRVYVGIVLESETIDNDISFIRYLDRK